MDGLSNDEKQPPQRAVEAHARRRVGVPARPARRQAQDVERVRPSDVSPAFGDRSVVA